MKEFYAEMRVDGLPHVRKIIADSTGHAARLAVRLASIQETLTGRDWIFLALRTRFPESMIYDHITVMTLEKMARERSRRAAE